MSDKSKDFLKDYHKKRDFDRTAEPFGGDRRKSDGRIFMVHKHDASNLHYDFRIEIDGVLKSWAVPKGPSTDPSDNRMAIQTEDHPIEYADFEGVIPEDQYGGGTVMVWDAGTYRNLKAEVENDKDKKSISDAYDEGKMTIWLEGKKLSGGYALIQTKRDKGKQWMMIKMKDDEADARRNPVSTENKSVLSDRTMKQIARDESETVEK